MSEVRFLSGSLVIQQFTKQNKAEKRGREHIRIKTENHVIRTPVVEISTETLPEAQRTQSIVSANQVIA